MRIAVVFDTPYRDWTNQDYFDRMIEEIGNWKDAEPEQEYQVADALIKKGHDVIFVGVREDLDNLRNKLEAHKTDLVFNLTEAFRDIDTLDYLVPAFLEAQGYVYTGASPQALMVTRNKAISKKILGHHGVPVPRFISYRLGERPEEDPGLRYPVIVKPLAMDASVGISKASVVRDFEGLVQRVKFIHDKVSGAAIVEEFVEGRELYASILGNGKDLQLLPLGELIFDKKTKQEERIATKSAKWDEPYREKMGIKNVIARPISKVAQAKIEEIARIAFHALWLRDYGRLDLRLTADDEVWVLEANANPFLSRDHEIAKSAQNAGLELVELVDRILQEAVKRKNGVVQ